MSSDSPEVSSEVTGMTGGKSNKVFSAQVIHYHDHAGQIKETETKDLPREEISDKSLTGAGVRPVDILDKTHYFLKQQLLSEEVLDYLLSMDVLTRGEFERCKDLKVKQEQRDELLRIISVKGEYGYKHFCISLEITKQEELKNRLDEKARELEEVEVSKFVYVSEIYMKQVVKEKDNVISAKDEEIESKTKEFKSEKTEMEKNHKRAMDKLMTEHADRMKETEKEQKKLNTELKQERESTNAAYQKLEEEKQVTGKLKEEKAKLEQEVADLKKRNEELAPFPATKEAEESSDDVTASVVEPGQCVLKTSSECNKKHVCLLQCLHPICKHCFEQYKHKTIVCRCRQEIELEMDDLPSDYISMNKAMLKAEGNECDYLAESCHNKVNSRCTTCNHYLCTDCLETHKLLKDNKDHTVIAIEQIGNDPPWKHPKNSLCTSHNQQLIYFDKQCKQAICNVCHEGEHEGHITRALEKEHDETKKKISSYLDRHESHLEQFLQNLDERRNRLQCLQDEDRQLEENIKTTYERNVGRYRERMKDLLQTAKQGCKGMRQRAEENIHNLLKRIASMEYTFNYAKMSFEYTSQVELLQLADPLIRKMEEDLMHTISQDSTKGKHLVFSHQGQKAFEDIVEQYGEVMCSETAVAKDDMSSTVTEMKHKLEAIENKLEELQSLDLTEKQLIREEAQREMDGMKDELKTLNSNTDDLQEKFNALSEQKDAVEEEARKSKNGRQKAEKEITHLQAKLAGEKNLLSRFTSNVLSLWAPLREQGIYPLRPDTMDPPFVLYYLQLKFDVGMANPKLTHVKEGGKLVNAKAESGRTGGTSDGFRKYHGTTTTVCLSDKESPQYLEIVSNIKIEKALENNNIILEIGLCHVEDKDSEEMIPARPSCYSLVVAHCTKDSSVCTQIWSDGRPVGHHSHTLPNCATERYTSVHYGIVYDTSRNIIVFLDINQMKVIEILEKVDYGRPMWPMFGVFYHPKNRTTMKLVERKNIDMSKMKRDLILNALEKKCRVEHKSDVSHLRPTVAPRDERRDVTYKDGRGKEKYGVKTSETTRGYRRSEENQRDGRSIVRYSDGHGHERPVSAWPEAQSYCSQERHLTEGRSLSGYEEGGFISGHRDGRSTDGHDYQQYDLGDRSSSVQLGERRPHGVHDGRSYSEYEVERPNGKGEYGRSSDKQAGDGSDDRRQNECCFSAGESPTVASDNGNTEVKHEDKR